MHCRSRQVYIARMISPFEVTRLMGWAVTGDMPPSSGEHQPTEILAQSFGTVLDASGRVIAPGATNIALAKYIVRSDYIQDNKGVGLVLQEEIAMAVKDLDPGLSDRVQMIPTIKEDGSAINTAEVVMKAAEGWRERRTASVQAVAFRHHLGRVWAHMLKLGGGIEVDVPDLRNIGDFAKDSSQLRTRRWEFWVPYELAVIGYCAVNGLI